MPKAINSLGAKLSKVGDSVTVHLYDNGFMVEANGRDKKEDWVTAKIMCPTIEDVTRLLVEASEMERD